MSIAISNVQVIDGTGRPPRERMTVLIEGGRFTHVAAGAGPLAAAHVIDGTGRALIPGLIDAHKHIMNNGGSHMAVGLTLGGIVKNLHTMVAGGVTSILDLGSADLIHALRHATANPADLRRQVALLQANLIELARRRGPVERRRNRHHTYTAKTKLGPPGTRASSHEATNQTTRAS